VDSYTGVFNQVKHVFTDSFPTIIIMCMFLYKILHVLCFGIVDVCEDEFKDVSEHVFS